MDKITSFPIPAKNINAVMVVFVLVMLCCLNAGYFLSMAANPLIQSDAWYFLDINIKKWIITGTELSDLFVKRSVVDHAQPLNKLFLYINYRFFNLDFRFESLIGLLGLFSIILFFLYHFLITIFANTISACKIIAFLMAIMILTSLNATGLYTWSLVTFSFLPLAIAFAFAWFTWLFLQKERVFFSLAFLLFSILVIGDTAAIILWLSVFLSIALIFLSKDKSFKKRAVIWLVLSGTLVAVMFLIINWSFIYAGNQGVAKNSQLQLTNLNFYLEAIRIIFSSSIVHGMHLTNIESYRTLITWMVALPIFYFYIKHFFDLLLHRKEITGIEFIVTFILIYASISIAAIIFGRVSEYGINYLHQPRYLVVYQLIPFSLLIKYAFSENKDHNINKIFIPLLAIPLIFIQLYVSASAYHSVPWVWKWHIEQTDAINEYINNPEIPAGNCTPHSIPICHLPVKVRNELLTIMDSKKLNLFNQNFQNKYRLFLDAKTKEKIN